jgi:hypothetical protein
MLSNFRETTTKAQNDDVKGVWVRFNLDMVENVFGLLYP